MVPTALDILKMKRPEELFLNEKNIKTDYSRLARIWHPDLNAKPEEANVVMAKINLLYEAGMELIRNNRWGKWDIIRFTCTGGKIHEIHYRIAHSFELGTMYIGNNVVAYVADKDYKDLFDNSADIISNFEYADRKMQMEVSKYLPEMLAKFETVNGQLAVVIKKAPDMFLLGDVLDYYGGKLHPRHTAWILSSMYNLACYIDYVGLSHNSISLDTYFISPGNHFGALLGGWWYTVPQDSRMLGVSEMVYSVMPPHIKSSKRGSIQTDLESIRFIGRMLLGDKNGTKLIDTGEIPLSLINWLRGAASENALKDYTDWRGVLKESFGERKFVEMRLNDKDLYAKIKTH